MATRRLGPIYVEPTMPKWWDRLVIVATLIAIVLLAADMGLALGEEAAHLLGWVDLGLCGLFLSDFAIRFRRASDRRRFVKRNWIDLVGSIPLVGPLRAARFVRFLRILRVTRIGALLLRLARRYDLPIPTQALGTLLGVSFFVWVGAAALFFYFEEPTNDGIVEFEDSLWWSMTTLSTVGYGDLYPSTGGGRVVAVLTMVLGVGVLGTLAATIAASLVDYRERGRLGLRSYSMSDHILLLGWNQRAVGAIEELRLDVRFRDTPVVIVADLESSPVEGGEKVRFVRGLPTHVATLRSASAGRAAAALVFARDWSDARSDHETALAIHAFRRVNPEAHVSAELVDPENREHFAMVGGNAVIDVNGIASSLLVRAVMDWGIADVVCDLLTGRDGSELYRVSVREDRIGGTYRDLVNAMLDERVTVMGLLRNGDTQLHPAPSETVLAGDEVLVVAEQVPG